MVRKSGLRHVRLVVDDVGLYRNGTRIDFFAKNGNQGNPIVIFKKKLHKDVVYVAIVCVQGSNENQCFR